MNNDWVDVLLQLNEDGKKGILLCKLHKMEYNGRITDIFILKMSAQRRKITWPPNSSLVMAKKKVTIMNARYSVESRLGQYNSSS